MIWSEKDLEQTFPELKNNTVLTLHSANHPDPEIPSDNASHQHDEELQTIHSFLDNLSFPLTLSDVEHSRLTKHAHQFFMQGRCLWRKNPAGRHQLVLFGLDRLYILQQCHDLLSHKVFTPLNILFQIAFGGCLLTKN
jgi:hypothetical protein